MYFLFVFLFLEFAEIAANGDAFALLQALESNHIQ